VRFRVSVRVLLLQQHAVVVKILHLSARLRPLASGTHRWMLANVHRGCVLENECVCRG
jgi:hypothetical protein